MKGNEDYGEIQASIGTAGDDDGRWHFIDWHQRGLLRLAAFGVDPFSCMNMGISGFLGMSFGNWQLIANILLLIVVFFTARSFIGLGTVVNMVFVGYIADFVCWLAQDAGMESPLALRIALLLVGIVMTCAGAGFIWLRIWASPPMTQQPMSF